MGWGDMIRRRRARECRHMFDQYCLRGLDLPKCSRFTDSSMILFQHWPNDKSNRALKLSSLLCPSKRIRFSSICVQVISSFNAQDPINTYNELRTVNFRNKMNILVVNLNLKATMRVVFKRSVQGAQDRKYGDSSEDRTHL